MFFMHMICMLPHVTRLVCDDQRLVLGSFWTLGECAQVPFSCILTLGGFCFSNTSDSVCHHLALIEYNQIIALVSSLINI
jgi:hypothetical protein